jgi:hypothetical protein
MAVLSSGCGSSGKRELAVCNSIHENPVLFDKVLIGGQPASRFPERTLTPASVVTRKLGKPDEILYLRDNSLFSWWRYGNTAYLVASLSANRPGHNYVAARACNWKRTRSIAGRILKNVH